MAFHEYRPHDEELEPGGWSHHGWHDDDNSLGDDGEIGTSVNGHCIGLATDSSVYTLI